MQYTKWSEVKYKKAVAGSERDKHRGDRVGAAESEEMRGDKGRI